ncbi:hypothetical protein [Cellulophaga sp. L1A9]|uniref:hypothetical protein n=1 Tax=Cellulophaga sp. L1A9 TaxID=2686362 RepID=UPI00131E044F|nr:hypothetical protein [Cellulophaga sp. L1A9]
MIKNLLIIIVLLSFLSCGNTKYTYLFEKGKNIDFSSGKWILNETYTNNTNGRIQHIAVREFKDILKDSLFELTELRSDKLVASKIPFEPKESDLKDLKIGTACDYLINIKSIIEKDKMGSFPNTPNIGSTKKTNQAQITIRIYDLNKLTLISESTVIGKAELTKNSDDGNLDYVNTGSTISMNGLSKLIRKYEKNKVINK